MQRQCAWCLRLMTIAGERISSAPLPKLYNATHGICDVCGTRWMEQATGSQDITELFDQLRARMLESSTHTFIEQNTFVGTHL